MAYIFKECHEARIVFDLSSCRVAVEDLDFVIALDEKDVLEVLND